MNDLNWLAPVAFVLIFGVVCALRGPWLLYKELRGKMVLVEQENKALKDENKALKTGEGSNSVAS